MATSSPSNSSSACSVCRYSLSLSITASLWISGFPQSCNHSDWSNVKAGGLKVTTLHGPDHLDDNALDVPFFLYGDQHHTRFPSGESNPIAGFALYVDSVLRKYIWYFSLAVVKSRPMVVLRVNMYLAGSKGSLAGSPTRAISGTGGSRPCTSWYGDIPVVLDTVMFRLNTTGVNQFVHVVWFSPLVTALSSCLIVLKDLLIGALLLGL